MSVDLRTPWRIGEVEIPTRLVLAPMAGVSVQAFRRQGRARAPGSCARDGLVAGIEHRNERTLGYLRVGRRRASARDPDLRQRPGRDAEAARLVEAPAPTSWTSIRLPGAQVTKTGAGATLLDEPERACRIVGGGRLRCGRAGVREDAPRSEGRHARLPGGRSAPVEAGAAS